MKKILVIEDCRVARGLLKLLLSKHSYQIDFKCSVEEVDTTVCPTTVYDLILSDYNLPGKTGFEFLKQIKTEGILPIPLIMMTANRKAKSECEGIEDILDAFLLKPFSKRTIDRLFDTLLNSPADRIKTQIG